MKQVQKIVGYTWIVLFSFAIINFFYSKFFQQSSILGLQAIELRLNTYFVLVLSSLFNLLQLNFIKTIQNADVLIAIVFYLMIVVPSICLIYNAKSAKKIFIGLLLFLILLNINSLSFLYEMKYGEFAPAKDIFSKPLRMLGFYTIVSVASIIVLFRRKSTEL